MILYIDTSLIAHSSFNQVVARGKLLLHKTYKDPGAITSLRFKVTSEMCPSMRVIIYFSLEDKGKIEVVSDYTVVHVESAFENKVTN